MVITILTTTMEGAAGFHGVIRRIVTGQRTVTYRTPATYRREETAYAEAEKILKPVSEAIVSAENAFVAGGLMVAVEE